MSLFIVWLWFLQQFVQAHDHRSERRAWHETAIGGPHGTPFTDLNFVNGADHKRIGEITFTGCNRGEHLSKMSIGWRDNTARDTMPHVFSYHGGTSNGRATRMMPLGQNEWINSITLHTFRVRRDFFFIHGPAKTRIGHIEITTNKNNKLSCGDFDGDGQPKQKRQKGALTPIDPVSTFSQPGSALLYFSGQAVDAIDQLQVHWISKEDF